jgi:hypothetical protein
MRETNAMLVLAWAALLTGCGAAPKVLIHQQFAGDDKNVRVLMQESADARANGKHLFDVIVSVCDVTEASAEAACKETKVLENVAPGSLY